MRLASVWLSLVALGLAALTGFVLWHSVQVSSLYSVQVRLDAWQSLWVVIRCSLLVLVAFGGSLLLYWRYRRRRINAHALQLYRARHWRLVAWLVVIEVLLGQQLLRHFFAALAGGSP